MNDAVLAIIAGVAAAVTGSFIYAVADTFGHRLDVRYGPGLKLHFVRRPDGRSRGSSR